MLTERPDLLDEAIVELADGRAPLEEFGTVAPARVLAVGKRHTLRLAAVPGVLRHAYLGDRTRLGERRTYRCRRDRRRRITHAGSSLTSDLRRPALTAAPVKASSAASHSAAVAPPPA